MSDKVKSQLGELNRWSRTALMGLLVWIGLMVWNDLRAAREELGVIRADLRTYDLRIDGNAGAVQDHEERLRVVEREL